MRSFSRTTLLMAVLLVAGAACFAQGPGGGAFAEFRAKHKFTFQLMQMVRHIGEIDKDPKYALKPDQAKHVLAILKPLRSKSKLTEDEAKQALKGLKPIFTVDQLNAMARIKPRPQMGQQRPGAGGPGGPGGNGQGRPRMRMDMNAMQDFNPFYSGAKAQDDRAAARAKRMDQFFSGLEQKSKGTKAQPKAMKKAK